MLKNAMFALLIPTKREPEKLILGEFRKLGCWLHLMPKAHCESDEVTGSHR